MFQGKRVVGIIAEFNPFHEGHAYLIRLAKETYQAELAIIAMSGDFVQRGEPAFFSKFERTEKALQKGADMILQMPVLFSTASAEDFAACGVAMLAKTGLVDVLCFGSECGQLSVLENVADFMLEEDTPGAPYGEKLKEGLRQGKSYPTAREEAIRALMPEQTLSFTANDILGVEYIKAMKRQQVSFSAGVRKRNQSLKSAHSIRGDIRESCGKDCDHRCYADLDQFSEMLSYRLLSLEQEGTALTVFSDVSRELADAIQRGQNRHEVISGRIASLKTKNYTYARISRALLHILLDIRQDAVAEAREAGYVARHRVLGVSRAGREMLGALQLPVLSSPAKWEGSRDTVENAALDALVFRSDLFASRLYHQLYEKPYNDFTERLRIL